MLVILDRDGVINEDSDAYIKSVGEWRPLPGSIDAIARLSAAGHRVAVATNQSGLARGIVPLDELERMHALLNELVIAAGGELAGIFYCPHHPDDGCGCRKPGVGLIEAVERELGESARGAWLIGDSLGDLQAAVTKACVPVLVATGKGERTRAQLDAPGAPAVPGLRHYADLASAADALLTDTGGDR